MEDINDKGRSLSELPANVLSHILSFLPTKEAVRTSILSKRWEYIWTSVPKLSFFEGIEPMDLVNIVDRSLRLRGSFDMTSFSLSCNVFNIFSKPEGLNILPQIESWISDVVRFNVQDVELNLWDGPDLTLPLSFVNCTTLTSLSIRVCGTLEFPSPVCFSNLKKLELSDVTFSDEHSTQELFSGCPMLEDLKLDNCVWECVKAVSVVSPRLQYFTLIEDEDVSENNFNGSEFVIFGCGLKYFHYEGEFQLVFNILNFQLLEEVHIKFFRPENGLIHVIDHFLGLLRYTANVPTLRLMDALWLLDIQEVLNHIPMFNGVRSLELNFESSDLSNIGLLMMLQNMLYLESLVFLEGIKMPSDPIEDEILEPLPVCFFNRLDFIGVLIRKGDANDLMGVKVLLKKATYLKEMRIIFSVRVNEDTRNNFCIELLKLPRGSRYCGIYLKSIVI